jgi:hypothetical protein
MSFNRALTMKVSIAVVLAVSAALAISSAYIGSHPEMLAQATGAREIDRLNHISKRFGQTDSAMIVVTAKSGTILERDAIQALLALTHRLQTSGACRAVVSLANLPDVDTHEDGADIRDLIERAPRDDVEVRALAARIRKNSHAISQLVSADFKDTMVVCPFSEQGSIETIKPVVMIEDTAVAMRFVGPQGFADGLADDLSYSAILYVVLGLVIAIAERRVRQGTAATLLLAVLAQAAIVHFAHPRLWQIPPTGLLGLLGPSATVSQRALDRVTDASHLVLVEAQADFTKATDLEALSGVCADLTTRGWQVSCPVAVLATMAQALTGDTALPSTDEQVKALWFFGGDRPELSMVFSQDKTSALVRMRVPEDSDLERLDADLVTHAHGLTLVRGGIPFVERMLSRVRIWLYFAVAALALLALVLGRLFGNEHIAVGEVLLAPSLLVKVGVASWVLLVIGLLLLCASIGVRTRSLRIT